MGAASTSEVTHSGVTHSGMGIASPQGPGFEGFAIGTQVLENEELPASIGTQKVELENEELSASASSSSWSPSASTSPASSSSWSPSASAQTQTQATAAVFKVQTSSSTITA